MEGDRTYMGISLKHEIGKRCNFPLKKSYVAAFLHAFQLNEILKLGVLNIICPITSDQLFALFFFFFIACLFVRYFFYQENLTGQFVRLYNVIPRFRTLRRDLVICQREIC